VFHKKGITKQQIYLKKAENNVHTVFIVSEKFWKNWSVTYVTAFPLSQDSYLKFYVKVTLSLLLKHLLIT